MRLQARKGPEVAEGAVEMGVVSAMLIFTISGKKECFLKQLEVGKIDVGDWGGFGQVTWCPERAG